MNYALVEKVVSCPFCAETITLLLDSSAGGQAYIEDCQVCCRPIQVRFEVSEDDGNPIRVQVDCAG